MVKWRMLNSDRVEVVPRDRQTAWLQIIVDVIVKCPNYNAYRTLINRANLSKFDYKRPIVYEVANRQLLINSEFLNKTLNRPNTLVAPIGITSSQIVLTFLCALILTLLMAITFAD
nr:pif6 [Calliteara abietis nucleopolyhedrovirus]